MRKERTLEASPTRVPTEDRGNEEFLAVQNFQKSFGNVPNTQLDIGIIGPVRGIVACTLRVQARIPGIRRSRSERTTFPLTPALSQGERGCMALTSNRIDVSHAHVRDLPDDGWVYQEEGEKR